MSTANAGFRGPTPGSYVSESDYFETEWQRAFWGSNYQRLLRIKRHYHPFSYLRLTMGLEAIS